MASPMVAQCRYEVHEYNATPWIYSKGERPKHRVVYMCDYKGLVITVDKYRSDVKVEYLSIEIDRNEYFTAPTKVETPHGWLNVTDIELVNGEFTLILQPAYKILDYGDSVLDKVIQCKKDIDGGKYDHLRTVLGRWYRRNFK